MYSAYQGGGRPTAEPRNRVPAEVRELAADVTDDMIAMLDLVGNAKAGAETLLATHPEVVFTSGRRGVEDQARAMAGNVVSNRDWIEQTYAQSDQRTELQNWVDSHPEATTKAQIQEGFTTIMNAWSDETRGKFSKHFGGLAFDVKPIAGDAGIPVKTTIKSLAGLQKFLEKEGGLVRWHAQFN
jgi:hypothetical protein